MSLDLKETICNQCLGTGAHPSNEDQEYKSINCRDCNGSGIKIPSWEIVELSKIKLRSERDAKMAQAVSEIESQFKTKKEQ